MIRLIFDDGNEYELIQTETAFFEIDLKTPYPNFKEVNSIDKVGNKTFTYKCISFNGKTYAAKLLNKE